VQKRGGADLWQYGQPRQFSHMDPLGPRSVLDQTNEQV
jgi:hypothetical protein